MTAPAPTGDCLTVPRQRHWWHREDTQAFGPLPDSVTTARKRTGVVLREWGVTGDLAGDIVTVVSELVTNGLEATWEWKPRNDEVKVRLLANAAWLAAEIWDGVDAVPVMRDPAPDREGGRGLMVVAAFSYRWGYFHRAGGGKVVYSLFGL